MTELGPEDLANEALARDLVGQNVEERYPALAAELSRDALEELVRLIGEVSRNLAAGS